MKSYCVRHNRTNGSTNYVWICFVHCLLSILSIFVFAIFNFSFVLYVLWIFFTDLYVVALQLFFSILNYSILLSQQEHNKFMSNVSRNGFSSRHCEHFLLIYVGNDWYTTPLTGGGRSCWPVMRETHGAFKNWPLKKN